MVKNVEVKEILFVISWGRKVGGYFCGWQKNQIGNYLFKVSNDETTAEYIKFVLSLFLLVLK